MLIELFEREFIETQEAVGMHVCGHFRDLDDPDRFVWLRGFRDMASRAAGLEAFYGGPVWKANRELANSTLIDSDDVLLLRPAWTGAGFSAETAARPRLGQEEAGAGFFVATIYHVAAAADVEFTKFFRRDVVPVLEATGAPVLAAFVTEHSENTFPRLPVREGDNVFVWFARFADRDAYDRYVDASRWPAHTAVADALAHHLDLPAHVLTLAPAARSLLR